VSDESAPFIRRLYWARVLYPFKCIGTLWEGKLQKERACKEMHRETHSLPKGWFEKAILRVGEGQFGEPREGGISEPSSRFRGMLNKTSSAGSLGKAVGKDMQARMLERMIKGLQTRLQGKSQEEKTGHKSSEEGSSTSGGYRKREPPKERSIRGGLRQEKGEGQKIKQIKNLKFSHKENRLGDKKKNHEEKNRETKKGKKKKKKKKKAGARHLGRS